MLAPAAALAFHGGFFPRGQAAFAVLALASATAIAAGSPRLLPAVRQPLVVALLALGALSALSAAWSIAPAEDALRWGAVGAAYGLLAFAAFLLARRMGAAPVAVGIAVVACAAGLVGLYGAGARVEPLAQRLGGQWSPGGPFEYSPALALAQVSALPVLLAGAVRRDGGPAAIVAAAGLAVAGSVLALAGSRVQLALGLAVVAGCALAAPRAIGAPRTAVLAAGALAATAGGLSDAVAGGYAEPYVTGDDAPRLLGLAAIVAVAPALWPMQRRLGTIAVIAPLIVALTLAATTDDSGPRAEPVSGFSHGRVELFEAAIDTAEERPLAGSGASSFMEASLPFQEPPPVRFAHNLPLQSWAELGLAGLLLVLAIYSAGSWLAWRRRFDLAGWLLGPAVVAFLIANLFDWQWFLPASGGLFAIALGGLAGAPAVGADSGLTRSDPA